MDIYSYRTAELMEGLEGKKYLMKNTRSRLFECCDREQDYEMAWTYFEGVKKHG